ncbi:MAG: 4-(cytidine 5'-diphospho)-2-C-methyl-D-erythritol kinase [Clostridia bacterium]|nr:4-(cytidine 5'-diphospho)-2-C-methyl-D-erythritol kinase [Clostridia bacterium]
MVSEIKGKAFAKINLTLDILSKLDNGYHLVKMIMQSIDLCDYITIKTNDTGKIVISSNEPCLPTDESNTAYKAAKLFFDNAGSCEKIGINIHIEKHIPSLAGLGGGSADAAAVLVLLNTLFENPLNTAKLLSLGKKVGADVPFCLLGGTMLAEGIGTDLCALVSIPDCFIVLAKPDIGVSTKEAYTLCDKLERKTEDRTKKALLAIENNDLTTLSGCLFNRFEEALKLEEVKSIRKLMSDFEALGSCMTGSGSAVFSIFDDEVKAKKCSTELRKYYKDVFICRPYSFGVEII